MSNKAAAKREHFNARSNPSTCLRKRLHSQACCCNRHAQLRPGYLGSSFAIIQSTFSSIVWVGMSPAPNVRLTASPLLWWGAFFWPRPMTFLGFPGLLGDMPSLSESDIRTCRHTLGPGTSSAPGPTVPSTSCERSPQPISSNSAVRRPAEVSEQNPELLGKLLPAACERMIAPRMPRSSAAMASCTLLSRQWAFKTSQSPPLWKVSINRRCKGVTMSQ
mmetsp:Transcript_25405/g.52793  ORF Transcript_25405/g.52793 Transcript_25405/m.52793 type:complete len:219 (+) Transcript_25405:22-678(+)